MSEYFLHKLISESDPIPVIVNHLLHTLGPTVKLDDLNTTYEKVEDRLSSFEGWLHETWGKTFYQTLVTDEAGWAIPQAFDVAAKKEANILFCDSFSIRELLVFKQVFKDRLSYSIGRAPAPTTTQNTAQKVFKTNNLKDAFKGVRLERGKKWKGSIIEDITNPPRLGKETGHMILTQYPDAPLHTAVSHRTTQVQEIATVFKLLLEIIENMTKSTPLVITGDHGYIYLGINPNRHLWKFTKLPRSGAEYGDDSITVDGVNVATGRLHANVGPGSSTFIAHGGISLTESIVPIIVIEGEI